MINTKFAKLTPLQEDTDYDELGRFPVENHKFLDDKFLLNEKNNLYRNQNDEWSSLEMTQDTRELINIYFNNKSKTLDIGCGLGHDTKIISKFGFDIMGIDKSEEAIKAAKKETDITFIVGDFMNTSFKSKFYNIYEKGVYHNLISDKQRIKFVHKIASVLEKGGVWLNISGCADSQNIEHRFGRIYFNELISIAETYFKVIQVRRSQYGKIKAGFNFEAWLTIFIKR